MRHLASIRAWLCAIAVCVAAPAALAQESPAEVPGKSAGDFMIRLRGIGVIPRDNADIEPIGGDTDLENTAVPEIDGSAGLAVMALVACAGAILYRKTRG